MHLTNDSDPTAVLREAKGLAQDLRKSLASSQPWDRSVEFQRQNLRRHYLHAVFSAKDTHSDLAQQLLWSETSHAIIDVYRAKIQAIEKAILTVRSDPSQQKGRTQHGPVELRKAGQSFRSFLAEEETFWRQFSLRVVRTSSLDNCRSALLAVGISDDAFLDDVEGSGSTSSAEPVVLVAGDGRHKKIEMLQRAVIYLGDLARYRQLNDASGTPKNGKAQQRRDRRIADSRPQSKNFAKAEAYYQVARTLSPDNGTPFNQLAILAMYDSDHFSALYYYYRAACARNPFATVGENMQRLLTKVLDASKRSKSDQPSMQPSTNDHTSRLEVFERDVILLHALWGKSSGSTLAKHSANIEDAFPGLIRDRVLPPEVLSRVFLMVFGALWRARLHRQLQSNDDEDNALSAGASTEAHIWSHFLHLVTHLVEIGQTELSPLADLTAGESGNLALRISAVFRRTLAALRVSTKWLKTNLDYFLHMCESHQSLVPELGTFWKHYVVLVNQLLRAFPPALLPLPVGSMDEDMDLRGFLPMKSVVADGDDPQNDGLPAQSQVHPNEEHLMRIADIMADAQEMFQTNGVPVVFVNAKFHLQGSLPSGESVLENSRDLERPLDHVAVGSLAVGDVDTLSDNGEREDDGATVSANAEDDPVSLAMRTALEQADGVSTDEEDDEMILFPRSVAVKPHPSSPSLGGGSRIAKVGQQRVSQAGPTTAQDLLLQVLGPISNSSTPRDKAANPITRQQGISPSSSIAPPQLLFGSGADVSPSIWSGSSSGVYNPSRQQPPTLLEYTIPVPAQDPFGRQQQLHPAPSYQASSR